jgi:hypothetical protein
MADMGIEGRRSERILRKVPIAVWCAGAPAVRAHTAVVNGHGALILSPIAFRSEALVRVLNQETGQAALCRVAWCGGQDLPGLFKVGIEILGDSPCFWGERCDAHAAAPAPPRAS